jgi:hypothetical protein
MEPLMAAAAEPTDMLRVGRSGGYRLTAAMRDRPLAARIGRLDPPCRSPECGGGRVDARTQPSGEPATPGQAEEAGDVLAALVVVDDCGRRRVSDVGLDAARAASPGSRAPQDCAGTDLREAR